MKLTLGIALLAVVSLCVSLQAATSFVFDYEQADFAWQFEVDGVSVIRLGAEATESGPLPVDRQLFMVSGGNVDSVTFRRSEPFSLGPVQLALPRTEQTTFAGDEFHQADFYDQRLSEIQYGSTLRTQTSATFEISRLAGKELITVPIQPLTYDYQTGLLTGHSHIELEFHGDSLLDIIRISDPEQYRQSTQTRDVTTLLSPPYQAAPMSSPQYLLVTSSELAESFQPLLRWKRIKGLTAELVLIGDILSSTAGSDDAERLRNYLSGAYIAGTRYVLLGGDENIVPIRYAYHSNTSGQPELDLMQVCDLYFADAEGDWDADGDGVYGEPAEDAADLSAELMLGRVPVDTPEEVEHYVSKLIAYEQNPGGGDCDYLTRSLFVAADQMRDYRTGGQQQLLAEALPTHFQADVSSLAEAPSGAAENPAEPTALSTLDQLSQGWGIVSLLAHGTTHGWVMRSNLYNEWPKNYMYTGQGSSGAHGYLPELEASGKPGLVYSIGCSNGAFDMDQPPFPNTYPCVAESFITMENGGAVAFVGYSRWGWVSSSWKVEDAFFDYLFSISSNVAEAMDYSKSQYPYYLDINYGLNLYGDPELSIWTEAPAALALSVPEATSLGYDNYTFMVSCGGTEVAGALVTVTRDGEIIAQGMTSAEGSVTFNLEYDVESEYLVYASKSGYTVAEGILTPALLLDVDNEEETLPEAFALHQNYPNPFNPSTIIAFELERPAEVTLEVFNILGQNVATVITDYLSAGRHEIEWFGRDDYGSELTSGVYFARIRSEEQSAVIKMTLIK